MPLQTYIPAALAIVFAVGFAGALTAAAAFLGPKRVSPEKLQPFECGSEPIGSPRARFSVKFYHVAILFLVFDVETAFMYPWVVNFRELSRTATGGVSLFGFVEMAIFVAVLVVALSYVWKKKAIGWD
ncbi:MAG: NADH-quinone oxidoreductase subunit A [Deltaproteobacteria bacterium]|nr:NADH-quinone oxidoreductase subunit A [Deltaproteobacteria bacterium]